MRFVVTLRNGWRSGDLVERQLAVRPLTGHDEMMLEEQRGLTPAAWANRLLAACAVEPGSGAPVGLDVVRELTLGDRERLLLGAYAVSFVRVADMLLRCRADGCDETIELSLDLTAFLAAPTVQPEQGDGEIALPIEGETRTVRYRLPTAGDLEAVADMARSDPAAAADLLIARCILSAEPSDFPAVVDMSRGPLAQEVSRRDPDGDMRVSVTCPSCGTMTEALLDAGAILRARCTMGEGIFIEVGRMARAYHWSEAEILALPRQRRRRYLDLAAQLEARQ